MTLLLFKKWGSTMSYFKNSINYTDLEHLELFLCLAPCNSFSCIIYECYNQRFLKYVVLKLVTLKLTKFSDMLSAQLYFSFQVFFFSNSWREGDVLAPLSDFTTILNSNQCKLGQFVKFRPLLASSFPRHGCQGVWTLDFGGG